MFIYVRGTSLEHAFKGKGPSLPGTRYLGSTTDVTTLGLCRNRHSPPFSPSFEVSTKPYVALISWHSDVGASRRANSQADILPSGT